MEYMRDAVACITIEGRNVRGTGFLVREDILVTALHVVADCENDEPNFLTGTINLKFRKFQTTAEIIKGAWNLAADCVLLKCEGAPNVRPLSLRQLGNSDDKFKTRGYPDVMPSGMMMHGGVVDHDADLGDTVQVVQLYCKEAAAGRGAPIKGMSGAPVMVGSDAVGLLRYALLDEDDNATTGTIFACHARDIIGLDPQLNLRPPYAAPTLSQAEWGRLNELVVEAFAHRAVDLGLVARFTLGTSLDGDITEATDIETRVMDLLLWAQKQGAGILQVLMTGVVAASPPTSNVRAFCDSSVAGGSAQTPDADLVDDGQRALLALVAVQGDPIVQNVLKGYRHDFGTTLTQIDVLARYKDLHTCLHTLQKMSDAIKSDLKRNPADATVRRALSSYADELQSLSREARPRAEGLRTKHRELRWIEGLDLCGRDILAMARRGVEAPLNAKDIASRLDEIQNNAARINDELYMAARFIELESLAVTIEEVVGQLGVMVAPHEEQILMKGSIAIGKLRYRLAGLVAEHDEWQGLNERLSMAATNPIAAAMRRIPDWDAFRAKLAGLCAIFPREDWSPSLSEILESVRSQTSDPTTAAEMEAADFEFWNFRRSCVGRFVAVDDELDELCDRIAEFGPILEVLLT